MQVVSIGGASLVSLVSLIFPLALNVTLHWHLMRLPERAWNIFLLLFSLFFAADGTRRGLADSGLL